MGLETMPDGTWCWHWGDNGDGKAFFMANLSSKDAVVYFANGANGLGIANELLAHAGGEHPSLKTWTMSGTTPPRGSCSKQYSRMAQGRA